MRLNLLIIKILLVLLVGCEKREIDFSAHKTKDGVEFHFDYSRINGLLSMQVVEKNSKTLLWDINLNYFRGNVLKHGEVPSEFETFNGVHNSAKQIYPQNNQFAKSIPPDQDIYVYLEYQFDEFLSPCISDTLYVFRVEANGKINNIGIIPHFSISEDLRGNQRTDMEQQSLSQ